MFVTSETEVYHPTLPTGLGDRHRSSRAWRWRNHSQRLWAEMSPAGGGAVHIIDGTHVRPEYLPNGSAGIPFVTVKNLVMGS